MPGLNKPERHLIAAAVRGDLDSFGQLCVYYYDPMVAVAFAIVRDHHLAQDAAQEAFARVLQNMATLRHEHKFPQWLAGVCRNIARDMARDQINQAKLGSQPQMMGNGIDCSDRSVVDQAINQLSPLDREIVILRYFNNSSHEQMSKILGLTKPAINNRLMRAKKSMKTFLRTTQFDEVAR